MGLSIQDYFKQLKALSPTGAAWPVDEDDSTYNQLLTGMATEAARVDQRADALIDEIDPQTTTELIFDWERVTGLPLPCVADLPTGLAERRAGVVSQLRATGGSSKQYFIDLAAAYGYEITITEFRAYKVGSKLGQKMTGSNWLHWWQVNAPLNTINVFKLGSSGLGEPFRNWGNEQLECLINTYKPAHTQVIFSYT